jgi:hypothetical protein
MVMIAGAGARHGRFSSSEAEIDSDDWTAIDQRPGFDGHHGLSVLDGAQF